MTVELLIEALKKQGISNYVVCAGARNIEIITELCRTPQIKIINHFEEREASFFALGLANKLKQPVALVCTSGTAVSECFSAVIEAYYSNIPLVILSADRPDTYRQTGAPQSIEQNNIFGDYARNFDITTPQTYPYGNIHIASDSPTHINICINEFVDQKTKNINNNKNLTDFLSSKKLPLIILGSLEIENQKNVERFSAGLNLPVYAEATSGLRESKLLDKLLIKSGEQTLTKAYKKNIFDGVLRIGGVPTCRFWRELENYNLEVISVDDKRFSGSPTSALTEANIQLTLEQTTSKRFLLSEELNALDQKLLKNLTKLIYQYPRAEASLVYSLSNQIHPNDSIFLGNSLPIREWDLVACRNTAHPLIRAQRGTNGIDGQLSNFLGGLDGYRHNWGLFGDLTTLYGLSAFWVLPQLGSTPVTICVINNSGGDIFSRVPMLQKLFLTNPKAKELVTNHHTIGFKPIADMWDLEYQKLFELNQPLRKLGKHLIEIIPDPQQTAQFWREFNGE